MESDELAFVDAVEQAAMVRRGDVTAAELAEAAIARIERINPRLNAVVTPLFEKGRRQAARADLATRPLGGVPYLLKDQLSASAGDPMFEGMRFLRDVRWTEPADSHVVTRYREAGLSLLGKTSTPELALLVTSEALAYGPCRNPWDPTRSVGGSSGGSAAAVAAGLVPIAHGTDAGGSIRIPASMCGVVGLKPSRGRVSQGPTFGDLWGNGSWHVHAITRTVRDSAAVLDASSGYCAGDPLTAPPPLRPFAAEVGADPGRLRVGFLARTPAGFPELDPECREAVIRTAALLEELGHRVEETHPAMLDHLTEGAVESFFAVAGSGVAWMLDRWSRVVGKPIGADDVEPYTWAFAELGRHATAPALQDGLENLVGTARAFAGWWTEGFALLLTPTIATPPFELGFLASAGDDAMTTLTKASAICPFTGAYNISGQPAISLPLHWSRNGLPVGVQLGAAYGREDVLFRVASQLEQARPWKDRRPPIHA